MSTSDLSAGEFGVSLQRLTGQDNYNQWLRDFKIIAQLKGVWKFYTGEESILTKPNRDAYLKTKAKRVGADAAVIASASDSAREVSTSEDHTLKVAEYKLDLDEYRDNDQKARLAHSLLTFWVDPAIRGNLQTRETPKEAWDWLEGQYKMNNTRALDIALSKMERLKLDDCKSMQEYLNQHEMLKLDITQCKGAYDDTQMVSKILRGLTFRYNTFVDQYYYLQDANDKADVSVRDITSRLLTFESKLQERAEQKAAVNKDKDKDNKGKGKGKGDKGDKGDKDQSPKDGKKTRPKCTYEPCGRWGHEENECRLKVSHQSKDGKDTKESDKGQGRRQIAAMVGNGYDLSDLRKALSEDGNKDTTDSSLGSSTKQVDRTFNETPHKSFKDEVDKAFATPPAPRSKINEDAEVQRQCSIQLQEELNAKVKDLDPEHNKKLRMCGYCSTIGHYSSDCARRPTSTSSKAEDQATSDGNDQFVAMVHNLKVHQPIDDDSHSSDIDDDENHADLWTVSDVKEAFYQAELPEDSCTPSLPQHQDSAADLTLQDLKSQKGCQGGRNQGGAVDGQYGKELCDFHDLDFSTIDLSKARSSIYLDAFLSNDYSVMPSNIWIADTAACTHIINNRALFTYLKPVDLLVGTADKGQNLKIEGAGTANITLMTQTGHPVDFSLTEAVYAPSSSCNLLSLPMLAQKADLKGEWDKTKITFCAQGEEVGCALLKGGLYQVQLYESSRPQASIPIAAATIEYDDEVWKWHRRLGHLSWENMRRLLKQSTGMDITDQQIKAKLKAVCPICATTRALVRIPRDPARRRYTEVGELLVVDTWGPYPITGIGDVRFAMFATDDATRFTWVRLFTSKGQIPELLRNICREIETTKATTIRRLRFDNEFNKSVIRSWTTKHGIHLEPSAAYAHHQVGTAERVNRTVREKASAMIQEQAITGPITRIITERGQEMMRNSSIPESLWPEAIKHSVWLKNRSPAKALKNKRTPFEAIENLQPSLNREKIWGSRAYVTIPPEIQRSDTKLHSPRGWLGYFVGCESESIYRIWDPEKKRVLRISAARIDDGEGLNDGRTEQSLSGRPKKAGGTQPSRDMDQDSDSTESHASDDKSDSARGSEADEDDVTEGFSDHEPDKDDHQEDQVHSDNDPQFSDEENKDQANLNEDPRFSDEDSDNDTGSEPVVKSKYFLANLASRFTRSKETTPKEDQASEEEGDEYDLSELSSPESDMEDESLDHKERRAVRGRPRKGIVRGRVPDDRICNRCMIHKIICNGERPCDACIRRKVKCVEQSLYAKSLIPKENRELPSAHLIPQPLPQAPSSKCRSCFKRNTSCQKEDPEGPCKYCIKAKIKCKSIEEDMRQNTRDKCRRCLTYSIHCQRESKTDSCTSCIEKGAECTNDYSGMVRQPYMEVSKPEPPKEKCHECRIKGRVCTHGRPCAQCVTREIECKPYKPRYGVSLEEKCSRCFKRRWACDGKDPCNRCLEDKVTCISQALVDSPKCTHCQGKRLGCDRKRPCHSCTKKKRVCSYFDDNNLIWRVYATDETKFRDEDEDECEQCLHKKRHCSGTEPCYSCVRLKGKKLKNCTWKRKGGLTEFFRVDPFIIGKEDAVEFDPSRPLPKRKEDIRTHPEADETSKVPEGGDSSVKKGKRPREPEISDDEKAQEDYEGLDEDLPDDGPLDEDLPDNEPLDEDLTDPSGFKYAGAVISSKMTLREPRSYKEAMNLPDADKWHEATELEMQSIITNHVFEVVDLPRGKRAISARWVYKRKLGPDGEILKHKARLVARGFQQREGIDFNETFSGVVKPGSYRILFALTAILGWISHQMDVKTAFLNADMQEEVYVNPPNPYALSKGQVWKMLRALYGFKQSPRAWYEKLSSKLKALEFRVSSYDQCVFIHDQKDLIITVHVDDLRIFGRSEDRIAQFKKEIRKEFDMTDEAEGTLYLGMHVQQSPGQVKLHQAAYIRKILERFNFQDITPVRTPCDPNMKLRKETSKEATDAFKHKYLQMFGSLNYLPSISRPDLAYATGLIGRYNANPNQTHMDAATRIYAYLADTINRGICYTKDAPELKGFVDSDYGGCRDTAKSTTGWVFILGGSPISWSSRRQQTVSLSSCEAEYVAATEAAKEAIWIKGFINNLRLPDYHVDAVPLHIDNSSAFKLARNPEMHQRTKHIAIRHHFIRQCVEEGEILLTWIKGTTNVADAFTKPLARPTFESFLKDMRIIDTC